MCERLSVACWEVEKVVLVLMVVLGLPCNSDLPGSWLHPFPASRESPFVLLLFWNCYIPESRTSVGKAKVQGLYPVSVVTSRVVLSLSKIGTVIASPSQTWIKGVTCKTNSQ